MAAAIALCSTVAVALLLFARSRTPYLIVCNLPDHYQRGMSSTLTVG